ncbi:siderophore-interacting protein [Clostridium algidicarnis]|uniref:siderophore-interacting protein n=1 Tax=Clostridium algidicarnis TaxID=37659 RepID=UPI001C0AB7CB|nr:siderophore-interacting protein [Clostridium algidicarnis]MBU3193484.1 siderophore-interacting protein [Clostridium algidicarnis]MBU3203110.1 siderophore-interacting protein [Clostridium algidicarnis]MBU3205592.1 siderophore-interacting protein [Clostridium algidicarnis]MBU3208706.1 siderophore-interacting protein [Clostridium algidicarnis]MBU3211264.1 siderophore-interacting protein [Clostridium algidicarnis]
MDLYKKAEQLLNSYVAMKVEIENSMLEIREIEADNDIKSINLDEKSSKTNRVNKEVENKVINKPDRIRYYNYIINKNEVIIEKIENSTKVLTQLEKDVIELKYFNNPILNRKDISSKIQLTPAAIDKIKIRAIQKMMRFL